MATPTKQELDKIKSLLDEVQKKYDQLGSSNPFRNFDASKIFDAKAATKQLEVAVKGVNAELKETNDEFSNTFQSLQSIVNELTKGKVATNKINNATKTLEDVSSKVLAQKNKGIKLDAKELLSLQKKSDISFTNLQQQRSQINAQKEEASYSLSVSNNKLKELGTAKNLTAEKNKERSEATKMQTQSLKDLADSETRLGNINAILDKSNKFQDVINGGLKRELLDRKQIESSIGITGGLLSSLSKVTGITGIFDIDQIKSEAEQIAEDAIEAFRLTDEYIGKEKQLNINVEGAKTSLLALNNVALLTQQEIVQYKNELASYEDIEIKEKNGVIKLDDKAKATLKQDIFEVKELLELGEEESRNIRLTQLEGDVNKGQKALEDLESEARSTANSMKSQFKTVGNTINKAFEGLGNTLKSPEAIFGALVAMAGQVNSQVVDLGKSLNISYSEAQDLRGELAGASLATGDNFTNTRKTVEAQLQYNEALGIQGKIIAENAVAQSRLTGALGVSVESASKLRLIAEATGEDFRNQTLQQYETINAVEQQVGATINVKQVMEEVGKAGAYGLAQFQGSVTALTEGVAQAKALGLSLDQVNSIAGKLLDFESSINAELQAELLLGKNINLEKARLAALNNDQKTLMEEINREMGKFEDFSKMNRIQQEAMAAAVGMTVDGLSESLLLQQYGEKSQREITDLAGEEVAAQVEKVKTQEAFNNAIEKMQTVLADIAAGPLGTIANLFTMILEDSRLLGGVMGVLGGVQLVKAVAGFQAMAAQMAIASAAGKKNLVLTAATAAMANPLKAALGLAAAGAAVFGTLALVKSATKEDDFVSPGYGKRTLSSPEGTIAFNDKDTIVAGTNLEQNTTTNINTPTQNSVINRPTTNSMVSNNQSQPQVVAPANNTMMEGELKAIKRVLENIATKEGTVSMNGTKFGTVTAMNTYQLQ